MPDSCDYVIGIDPSSKLLAFVGGPADDEIDAAGLFSLGTGPYTNSKLLRAERATQEFLGTLPPLSRSNRATGLRVAVVEDPLVGVGSVAPTIKQAFVNAVVCLTLLKDGWVVHGANVSTWKALVIGDGKASKDRVAEHLRDHRGTSYERLAALAGLPGSAPGQDLTDALGIREYGLGLLSGARGVDVGSGV